MKGVNFAQQNNHDHDDPRHGHQRDAIEYTSGKEPTVPMSKQHTPPSAEPQPVPEQTPVERSVQTPAQTPPAPASAPEKKSSFFSWRGKRTHTDTSPQPSAEPQSHRMADASSARPIAAPAPIHDAPQHHRESVFTDLLKAHAPQFPSSLPEETKKSAHSTAVEPPSQVPLSLDVNFIPDDVLEQFETRNRLRDLLIVGLGVVIVVLLAYGGFNIYQQKIATETAEIAAQSAELDTQIARYTPAQQAATQLDERLTQLEAVLARHVYWTPVLNRIEQLTLPTVYYTSLAGSAESGAFTLDAIALDYNQIDAQVNVLKNDPSVLSVETTSAQRFEPTAEITATTADATTVDTATTSSSVSFSLTVQFDPSVFQFSLFP